MLYHSEIGIPQTIKSRIRSSGRVRPIYGTHARAVAEERAINLPNSLDLSKCRPFEIEVKRDGTIIKVAYRTNYASNSAFDLILVIHPDNNFVRTVWLNPVGDKHTTLDTSKYELAQSNPVLELSTN